MALWPSCKPLPPTVWYRPGNETKAELNHLCKRTSAVHDETYEVALFLLCALAPWRTVASSPSQPMRWPGWSVGSRYSPTLRGEQLTWTGRYVNPGGRKILRKGGRCHCRDCLVLSQGLSPAGPYSLVGTVQQYHQRVSSGLLTHLLHGPATRCLGVSTWEDRSLHCSLCGNLLGCVQG